MSKKLSLILVGVVFAVSVFIFIQFGRQFVLVLALLMLILFIINITFSTLRPIDKHMFTVSFEDRSHKTRSTRKLESIIGSHELSSIQKPTPQDIQRLITKISAEFSQVTFTLESSFQTSIFIHYVIDSDRVILEIFAPVAQRSPLYKIFASFLVDETLLSSNQLVEFDNGAEDYPLPIYYSVTRERAIEVCTQFLNSTEIPANTTWGRDQVNWENPKNEFKRF